MIAWTKGTAHASCQGLLAETIVYIIVRGRTENITFEKRTVKFLIEKFLIITLKTYLK